MSSAITGNKLEVVAIDLQDSNSNTRLCEELGMLVLPPIVHRASVTYSHHWQSLSRR